MSNSDTELSPVEFAPGWELVVGLEVHAELLTTTKLFSAAPASFGDEPNTNITPVCLGMPGSLPVLNKQAVEQAIKIGLALGCEICPSVFHRKNYFYPDMPKNFQISQYDEPICRNGHLELLSGVVVGIERAHLEEDAGKTTHAGHTGGGDDRIHGASYALLDYNRAGRPLLEIVSRPDISSAADARTYVEELQAILRAVGASEALLEEGSMRIDANISVRPAGSDELRTRTEVKNLNSLRSLTRAIEYEAKRHIGIYEAGEQPQQQTRHWAEDGKTHAMRTKEEEDDYGYFTEPDLVLLSPDAAWIERLRAEMPELPAAKRARLVAAGVSQADAATLIERKQADLVLAAIDEGAESARVAARVLNNLKDREKATQLATNHFVDFLKRFEETETQRDSLVAEGARAAALPPNLQDDYEKVAKLITNHLEALLKGFEEAKTERNNLVAAGAGVSQANAAALIVRKQADLVLAMIQEGAESARAAVQMLNNLKDREKATQLPINRLEALLKRFEEAKTQRDNLVAAGAGVSQADVDGVEASRSGAGRD